MKKNSTVTSVILWSVISAAFIGPGTVTTAASAGSLFQLDLLWAVTFAVIACIVLQEVSARMTILSGMNMGRALDTCYGPVAGKWLKFTLAGPVILGCAAYEAGNILGAVSGMQLMSGGSLPLYTVLVTVASAFILWLDKRETIGWLMTMLVALMGISFVILAASQPFPLSTYVGRSLIPQVPPGSELLMLGLVGTTIVPYNLFLGSGISKGQTVPLMRIGLTISVLIGGLITAAILVAGTSVTRFSNFEELSAGLSAHLGPLGALALGAGLFGAGFSSAITSPYASSIIASSVFEWSTRWQRAVWIAVLLTGFLFGISGIKPIPVILAVQALNGLVLPLLAAFLILLINHPKLLPGIRQSFIYNAVLLAIFSSVLMMGLNNIDKSVSAWLEIQESHLALMLAATVVITGVMVYLLFRQQRRQA